MNHSTHSVPHSLVLIPISSLINFSRLGDKALVKYKSEIYPSRAIPGTIHISSTIQSSIYKKKITYERSEINDSIDDILEILSHLRLIAIYEEETGRSKVCGSPDYPLSLEYNVEDGLYIVSLEGQDIYPDAFIYK